MKRIILVSNAFYPEISPRSFRATELAKEFCRNGYDVKVISKFRNHNYDDLINKYRLTLEMWKNSFLKIPEFRIQPLKFIFRGISRFLSVLFEYPAIEETFRIRRLLKKEQGYDLLISFAVPFPVHWGVALAWNNKKPIAKTWVADCGDPYMFAKLDTFRKPFYFKYFEILFCKKCDFITIPYKELLDQFYPEFIKKIRLIPQGFDFSEVRLYTGRIANDKPTFIFAGTIIPIKRDLSLFLDFLCSISTDFIFIVYTNQNEWYKKYKEILQNKLELRSYIDRISLIYELSKADFLVTVDTPIDKNSNTEAVPSKLIDYALSTRPILNLNTGYLDRDTVLDFLKGEYSKKRVVDITKYDIRTIASQFIELSEIENN